MASVFQGAIILDDSMKLIDALSEAKRKDGNNRLVNTVKSRKASPDTPIVVIMQRLAEGAPRDQAHTYAGFGTRFAAQFVDNIIIGVISVPLAFALAGAMPGQDPGLVAMVALPFRFVILFIYDTLMIGKFGATLGKMACKTKVVNANGTDLSFGQAAGRAAMKVVSFLTCLIGFIIAAFDAERRALHDRACGTRVIVKR